MHDDRDFLQVREGVLGWHPDGMASWQSARVACRVNPTYFGHHSLLQPRDMHSKEFLEMVICMPGWQYHQPLTLHLCGINQTCLEPKEHFVHAEETHYLKKPFREAFFCFSQPIQLLLNVDFKKKVENQV